MTGRSEEGRYLMRVRDTISLVMGGMVVLGFVVALLGGGIITGAASLTLEQHYAKTAALLIRWEIQRELVALAFLTRDFAEWDWMWLFIEAPDDPARNFESEVPDQTLLDNRIGLVAVCRKDGTLLLGKCLDLETGGRQALPKDLPEQLRNMVSSGVWERPRKGFVWLDGQVWGWSSHPVTRTDCSAPHNGFLIFAKPLDEILKDINRSPLHVLITKLSQRPLDTLIRRPQQGVADMRPKMTFPYQVYPAEGETGRMRVDLTLYGLDGQSVALVTTVTSGLFFHSHQHLWYRALTLRVLGGVVFMVVLYGLLTRLVSTPVERLRTFIVGLDPARPTTERLSTGPGREFRELAGAINGLLDTLETVREEESRARDQLQQSEEQFRTLFNQMVAGAALYEIIYDASGEPVDYRLLAVNKAFERLTGLKREDVLGRTVREIIPHLDSFWIRFLGETAKTGRSAETIHEEPEVGRFYEARTYSPEEGRVVALFTDVTERALRAKQRKLLLTLTDRLNGARNREEVVEALRECFNEAYGDTETALYRVREADAELLVGSGKEVLKPIVWEIGQAGDDPCFWEGNPEEALRAGASVVHGDSGTGERIVIVARIPGMSRWDPWKQNLFRMACSLAGTTLVRVMSDERLRRRLELEALVTASSMQFIRGEPAKIGEQIRSVLEDTGRYCEASYISLLLGLKDRLGSDFFWWSSPEGTATPEKAGAPVDPDGLSWLYHRLQEGNVVPIDGLDSLPEEATDERQMLVSRGWAAASIRIIPLMLGDSPMGVLTLVREERPDPEWLREELPHLHIIGDLMQLAWQRAQTIEALRQRVHFLLNPPVDKEEYSLELLFNSEELQRLLDAFARAEGICTVITDAKGKLFIRSAPMKGLERCNEEWLARMVRQIPENNSAEQLCFCPICEYVFCLAPIRAGRMQLGYWVIGMPAEEVYGVSQYVGTSSVPVWLTPEALEHDAFFRSLSVLVIQMADQLSSLAVNNIRQAQLLAQLTESEFLQRRLFMSVEGAGDAILFCDESGRVIYTNKAADRLFDRWFSGLEGDRWFRPEELPDARVQCEVPVSRWFRETQRIGGKLDFSGEDGHRRYVAFSLSPIQDPSENRVDWLVVCQDISRQEELEEQLIQSRKMEAIGNLVSGVAHDFNNLLQVISGNAEILAIDLPEKSENRHRAQEIAEASHRAASLTRQLLTFSRQQPMRAEPVDVNRIVTQLMKMLQRVLGVQITLELNLTRDLPQILGDTSYIDQVLINLCVNARDAMPDGGRLTITTETVDLPENYRTTLMEGLPGGRYVCLSVSDTGTGIAPEILPHIFDPYFTTKERGKGTGLGLASVYGIVSKHTGGIDVLSTRGQGTTFRIYLPVLKGPESESELPLPAKAGGPDLTARLRGRRVLLAEDDAPVRGMTARFLRSAGIEVVEAADGEEALERFRAAEGRFDALVLDVVMPGLNGWALYEAIRETHPQIPVILSTGYAVDLVNEETTSRDRCCALLFKPYTSATLLGKLAELIRDASGGG